MTLFGGGDAGWRCSAMPGDAGCTHRKRVPALPSTQAEQSTFPSSPQDQSQLADFVTQDLDMAREPKPSRARLGQKRQHGSSLYHGNCELDYDLYRDDFPYRVYEYQKIPPLINRIPVKARRTHVGAGGKSIPSPQPGSRSSSSSVAGQTKLRAEELHSIKGELSQIKAQVDSLLESLDRMDQRRERLAGSKESEKKAAETGAASPSPAGEGSRELRGKEGTGADGHSDLRSIDSAKESTDTEETVKTHTSDPEGSQ